jgi:3-hydroxyacyl-[acyl-carrier-protein] dehydratase
MFSHIDQNLRGLAFPEHNFVFTEQFFSLMRNSGVR